MLFVSDDDSILIHLLLFGSDSGQVLSCTLWENYCLQFLSYLNDIEDERPIVILLTHARIKEAQGQCNVRFLNFQAY